VTSSLVFGKKKIRDTVKNTYNLDILNTTIPAPEIVEMIQNAITNKNESFGQASDGIRILFYGLSGTGKTELARYISEKTGKKLLIKRVSDIIDKFVGETEQNISAAFEEAEETDSILLFDEADTFFANRENATHSWERTMVNEFLTQMEEFSGILICTTNLRKIMDPAMQRRFHILTEFKPLKKDGIKSLLSTYFNNFTFTDQMIMDLSKFDTVTPGDFGSLSGKIRFMSKEKITPEFIIRELQNIQSEKQKNGGRTIGFAS
jgi:SpoVK/Ycf46/Vps4 family AAA+-type ATPase